MPKFILDYADGRYSTRLLTDAEAEGREAQGGDVVYLDDRLYAAYSHACGQDALWQTFFRTISNEQDLRRRERELLPLEEAERKIAHLTAELERSQSAFNDGLMIARVQDHSEEYIEYTCVHPQPGCKIEALPEEWRESAQVILDRYRSDRVEGGLKYQGCCCGHMHKLLDAAEAQRLRDAGFLVENDTEIVWKGRA